MTMVVRHSEVVVAGWTGVDQSESLPGLAAHYVEARRGVKEEPAVDWCVFDGTKEMKVSDKKRECEVWRSCELVRNASRTSAESNPNLQ